MEHDTARNDGYFAHLHISDGDVGTSAIAKFVLGVHKSATNIAVLSELGLFPLSLCTIKATINYWLHLLSANANSLIYHSYQENTLRKAGLCSKIKLLLADIGFTHVWVNQGTFSKSKLLHSLSIKLEDRYINHWKKIIV